jgi:monofunctional biosynthetic peptidoglycan transglycosylase
MKRAVPVLAWAALVLALVPVAMVPVYALVPPVSTLMIWRWMTGERVVRQWLPIEAISSNLVRAVVVAEDARLCSHSGVDWSGLRDAIEDAEELIEVRGASTIAMQTAKNLFLWPGRQYVRKAIEIPIAYYLTLIWPKRRLVEVYLNIVEWGPDGEFGAEAAARRAFRKSARDLSVPEAALLAAALPNPIRRNAARPGPGLQRVAARHRAAVASEGGAATACLRLRR